MREILFRGKSIDKSYNGQWVYGGIIHQTDFYGDKVDRYYIMDGTVTIDYDIGDREQVAPETIGQFTGLLDKNGKRIFEGDILLIDVEKEAVPKSKERHITKASVAFEGGGFTLVGGELVLFTYYGLKYLFKPTSFNNYEVIGNIHDNPELLEVVK